MGVSGIGIYKIRFSFSSSSLGLVEYVDVGVDMTYVRNKKFQKNTRSDMKISI